MSLRRSHPIGALLLAGGVVGGMIAHPAPAEEVTSSLAVGSVGISLSVLPSAHVAPSGRATSGEQQERPGDLCLRAHGFDRVQLSLLRHGPGSDPPTERLPVGPGTARLSREACLPLDLESVLGPLDARPRGLRPVILIAPE